ncbi:Alpha/Beta hydrolase protein, partial [Lineolata rhizophorae]
DKYDWRAQEDRLNAALPQFRTTVDISDPNARRRPHHDEEAAPGKSDAVPLLFCHGWPGSFIEVAPLAERKSAPRFHVVAPSIPGFGFSDASVEEGFGLRETARTFDGLMRKLGYERYVAHGTGW